MNMSEDKRVKTVTHDALHTVVIGGDYLLL